MISVSSSSLSSEFIKELKEPLKNKTILYTILLYS